MMSQYYVNVADRPDRAGAMISELLRIAPSSIDALATAARYFQLVQDHTRRDETIEQLRRLSPGVNWEHVARGL